MYFNNAKAKCNKLLHIARKYGIEHSSFVSAHEVVNAPNNDLNTFNVGLLPHCKRLCVIAIDNHLRETVKLAHNRRQARVRIWNQEVGIGQIDE